VKHTALTPARFRSRAREALFYSSNWISVLLVSFAVMLLIFSAVSLADSLITLISDILPLPAVIRPTAYLVQYLLFSPLLVGQLHYYTDLYRAAHGDIAAHVPPAAVFAPYASPRVAVRAWGEVLTVLFLCALIPVSLSPALIAVRLTFANRIGVFPAVLLTLSGITAFLSVLYLNARLTPFLYLTAERPQLPFSDAIRRAWRLSADSALTGVLLQLGLLFSAVLSVLLTAGVLFFLYVLPIAVFTYVSYCHTLSGRHDPN